MRPKILLELSHTLLLTLWLVELSMGQSQDLGSIRMRQEARDRLIRMNIADGERNPLPLYIVRAELNGISDSGFEPLHSPFNQSKAEERNAYGPTHERSECPSTSADCLCDADKASEYIIHVNLKTISTVDPNTKRLKCFADEDPMVACENRKCVIIPNKNFEILFQKGKKMDSSNYLDNTKELDSPPVNTAMNFSRSASGPMAVDTMVSAFYPVEYTYLRTLGESDHLRFPRSAYGSNMCRVPSLANSEVTCWKWPNWQTCKQTCIYGHGLENGGKTIREKSFTCRNTENKWKPHIIRDCEPFMNCKVHLKSPGDLNCVEPTDGPAYCDINCADYDDYKGHGKVRWKCEEKAMLHGGKGGKGNPLPHCAEFEEAELRLNPPDY